MSRITELLWPISCLPDAMVGCAGAAGARRGGVLTCGKHSQSAAAHDSAGGGPGLRLASSNVLITLRVN